jgi:hypothetical protein
MVTDGSRPGYDRPGYDRPRYDRPRYDRPSYDRPRYDRPSYDRPGLVWLGWAGLKVGVGWEGRVKVGRLGYSTGWVGYGEVG